LEPYRQSVTGQPKGATGAAERATPQEQRAGFRNAGMKLNLPEKTRGSTGTPELQDILHQTQNLSSQKTSGNMLKDCECHTLVFVAASQSVKRIQCVMPSS
jgi:hypothetical protein